MKLFEIIMIIKKVNKKYKYIKNLMYTIFLNYVFRYCSDLFRRISEPPMRRYLFVYPLDSFQFSRVNVIMENDNFLSTSTREQQQ